MRKKATRTESYLILTAVYLLAGVVGTAVHGFVSGEFWIRLLIADIVATAVVYLFSLLFHNASVYDPYWSVQPLWILTAVSVNRPLNTFGILLNAVIWIWGIRLTANWAYTFSGLHQQDWRYTMFEEQSGTLFPLVSFFGIHLFPTLIVWADVLPAAEALRNHVEGGIVSYFFLALSLGAVFLQGMSDFQMHRFRKEHKGELIRFGLWKRSRHPNYLGEIIMWWGIALSVQHTMMNEIWICGGAMATTLLFLFVSIPMADRRQSQKPGYEEYRRMTRML